MYLSGTYFHKTGKRLPSCTTPRELTIITSPLYSWAPDDGIGAINFYNLALCIRTPDWGIGAINFYNLAICIRTSHNMINNLPGVFHLSDAWQQLWTSWTKSWVTGFATIRRLLWSRCWLRLSTSAPSYSSWSSWGVSPFSPALAGTGSTCSSAPCLQSRCNGCCWKRRKKMSYNILTDLGPRAESRTPNLDLTKAPNCVIFCSFCQKYYGGSTNHRKS